VGGREPKRNMSATSLREIMGKLETHDEQDENDYFDLA
jgi:hypothetical protein